MEVNVNSTIRVDISLTVGELEESVTVTGEAPMLQTDRTDTGRIIQSEQITQTATRVQSELPGRAGDRAGRVTALPSAFGVLQFA